MTETDKLLVRIGTARDAISRKPEQTSLDYMIDGVLMECSVLLKEQNGLMLALEQSNAVNEYLNTEVERLNGLLKEQEAIEPEMEGGGSSWWYVCGECHGAIDPHDGFCRHCGREIKKKTACDGCNYKGSEDCPIGTPGWENAFCPNGKL